jgi:hypothetical protein
MLRRFRNATPDRSVLPLARALTIVGLAAWLTVGAAGVARADDSGPSPMPRTAITIGGASVVLIATTDKLYAFVDRLDINAPVEDAQLQVDTADGGAVAMNRVPLTMNKATAGMFVGPLDRKGHMQDAFMVTLHSSVANGQAPAEIAYTDAVPQASGTPTTSGAQELGVVLVSGAIGAVGAMVLMLWLRSGRRRRAGAPVGGSAQTV